MLGKSGALEADEIVIDLEDAVAPNAKEDARELVASFLADDPLEEKSVAVRINGLDTPWGERDVTELAQRAGTHIDSLVVPMVERAEHLEDVDRLLGDREIGLQALLETAGGLQRAGEIAAATQRTETLIIGYADLAASLGRPPGGDDFGSWIFAQETVLVGARAANLQAIDGPYLGIRDEDGLRKRAEHVRGLGYDGKWAVHPAQVPVINDVFTPSQDEFDKASAIVAALEEAEGGAGRGAVELDGAMIDEASRKLAVLIVARGEAAGLRSEAGEEAPAR
jgi:citrate lyase subunit beta / citryl-CoA lyase